MFGNEEDSTGNATWEMHYLVSHEFKKIISSKTPTDISSCYHMSEIYFSVDTYTNERNENFGNFNIEELSENDGKYMDIINKTSKIDCIFFHKWQHLVTYSSKYRVVKV